MRRERPNRGRMGRGKRAKPRMEDTSHLPTRLIPSGQLAVLCPPGNFSTNFLTDAHKDNEPWIYSVHVKIDRPTTPG